MFLSDGDGRLHHALTTPLDRRQFQAMHQDVMEAKRVLDSQTKHATLSSHLLACAQPQGNDDKSGLRSMTNRTSDPSHPTPSLNDPTPLNSATASHPKGFPSDSPPVSTSHECSVARCHHSFPPLFVDSCLTQHDCTLDAGQRTSNALVVEQLFQRTLADLLHRVRFSGGAGGSDLFSREFLLRLDERLCHEMETAATEGKRMASEELEGDSELDEAVVDEAAQHRKERRKGRNAGEPPSGAAASIAESVDSTDHVIAGSASSHSTISHPSMMSVPPISHPLPPPMPPPAARISRHHEGRNPADSESFHPFAPSGSGAHSARDGRSGRLQSRRMVAAAMSVSPSSLPPSTSASTHAALLSQRSRQCLLSSTLALIRLSNAFAARLNYWHGQAKKQQRELTRLTILTDVCTCASDNSSSHAMNQLRTDAEQREKEHRATVQSLQGRMAQLEQQLSAALERAAPKYEARVGDTTIEWNCHPHHSDDHHHPSERETKDDACVASESDAAAARLKLASLQSQLDSTRADLVDAREELNDSKAQLDESLRIQSDQRQKILNLQQMLQMVKERVGQREKEWEEKERAWKMKMEGARSQAETSHTSRIAELESSLASERARYEELQSSHTSYVESQEALECTLRSAAQRARAAHAAALKEFEDLRRRNEKQNEEYGREREKHQERLNKATKQLSESRTSIVNLKESIKTLNARIAELEGQKEVANAAVAQVVSARAHQRTQQKRDSDAYAPPVQTSVAIDQQSDMAATTESEADAEVRRQAAAQASQAAAERVRASTKAQKAKQKATIARLQAEKKAAVMASVAAAPTRTAAFSTNGHASARGKKQRSEHEDRKENTSDENPPMHADADADANAGAVATPGSTPRLPAPTAEDLLKPTPKLSHGYGRCVYGAGEWYEGWWKDFKRHGQGTYHWHDGRRYTGQWMADKKHGKGTYTWRDGDWYEGEYVNDKMDGHGTYHFRDGTRYVGEWSQDASHGHGRFLYADGAEYVGDFYHDEKHGRGRMTLPSGEVFSEHWIHGKRISSICTSVAATVTDDTAKHPSHAPRHTKLNNNSAND